MLGGQVLGAVLAHQRDAGLAQHAHVFGGDVLGGDDDLDLAGRAARPAGGLVDALAHLGETPRVRGRPCL